MAFATLFLLGCLTTLAFGWNGAPLKRVDLEIIDGHFIRLQIGQPERTYAFYIDLEYEGILMSRPDTEIQSNSFAVRADGEHSDLFVLGSYILRLPYRMGSFTLERAIQMSSQQSPVGKIGLGAHSPLWRYWGNFSLTNSRLRLGPSRDSTSGNNADDENTPALISGKGYCENPATGTGAGLTINFGILNLLLPHSLSEEEPSQLSIKSCANPIDCGQEVSIKVHNQEINLIGGLSFTAVDLSHDGLVHLGRRFFYDIHLFVDWSADVMVISDLLEFNRNFNAVYVMLTLAMLVQWTLIRMHQGKDRPEMEKTLVFLLELFLVALGVAHWATNFFIYSWSAAIAEFLDHWQAVLATVYIHTAAMAALALSFGLLYYEYRHVLYSQVRRFHFVWHILALANLCLPIFWSAFVQHHHILIDMGFMLFFATMLVLINGTVFCHACVFAGKPLRLIAALMAIGSYVFLSLCNVMPFYDLLSIGERPVLFVLQYLLLFCVIPTILLTSRTLRHFVLRHPRAPQKGENSEPSDFISQLLLVETELI